MPLQQGVQIQQLCQLAEAAPEPVLRNLVEQPLESEPVEHGELSRDTQRSAAANHRDLTEKRVLSSPRYMAQHSRPTRARVEDPAEHFQRRGLAGAIRSEEADDLSWCDSERYASHCRHLPKPATHQRHDSRTRPSLANGSAETVRRYEQMGFLPSAERTASGQRRYTGRHLGALEAARAMQKGYGWLSALEIMQRVHAGDVAAAFTLADSRHAWLHERRQQVARTLEDLRTSLSARQIPVRKRAWRRSLYIGEAAAAVGVRISAIRYWEDRGLLSPQREASSDYRLYDEEQMRRLRVVALLRNAGYGFDRIAHVLSEIKAGRLEGAITTIERRLEELGEQSRLCAAATAALWQYVNACEETE